MKSDPEIEGSARDAPPWSGPETRPSWLMRSLPSNEVLAKYYRLFHDNRDGYVLFDLSERILHCNPAYAQMLGYSELELRELKRSDITPEQWAPADDLAFEQVVERGYCDLYEKEYRRQDGTVFPVEVRSYLDCDARGQATGTWSLTRNIAGRKRTEQAIQESEALLRESQAIAGVGSYELDIPAGRWKSSPVLEQLFGLGEAFDRPVAEWAALIHPADQAMMMDYLNSEVLGRGRSFKKEYRIVRPNDGVVRWVSGLGQIKAAPDGRLLKLHGTIQDITERKQSEEDLRNSQKKLRALSAHMETLREQERSRIAREIHDELGQMLTRIKMDLRAMEHSFEQFGTDDRVNPILDKLVATAELTDATVKVVQRISAELRPGVLDSLGLPTALEHEAAQFAEHAGLSCRVDLPGGAVPALRPEVATAFFRIFQEALTNVSRHADATAVEAELRMEGKDCRLDIGDNGKGITPADIARPTALGLLGMQERARLVGGHVSFGSRAGGGTVVTVLVPGCLASGENS